MDVIKINSISKIWPGIKALDQINFSVKKGTIHGFLGPNGAGKSTTMNILTGLISPTSGDIQINGKIGFLPEHPPLYLNMVVKTYLKFVAEIHHLNSEIIPDRINEVISKCGIESVKNRLIKNLSKGYKQRVALAQAIIHNPDIIILDEPTVGLDPNSVVEIRNLIISLKDNHTVLFSSHQLSEVDKICDNLTIISKGQIVKSSSKDEIKKMFRSKQIVIVEIKNWDNEREALLHRQLNIEKVKVINNGNTSIVRIYLKSMDDKREIISKFMVENQCGLISLIEEKLELEDIFKQVTSGDNQ